MKREYSLSSALARPNSAQFSRNMLRGFAGIGLPPNVLSTAAAASLLCMFCGTVMILRQVVTPTTG